MKREHRGGKPRIARLKKGEISVEKTILLLGLKKSGKTTAFEIIRKNLEKKGLRVKEIMLALTIKRALAEAMGFPVEWLLGDHPMKEKAFEMPFRVDERFIEILAEHFDLEREEALKKLSKHLGAEIKSPRHAMQYAATEMLRDYEYDIHCIITKKRQMKDGDVYVVTDVRFPNEFEYFGGSAQNALHIKRESTWQAALKELEAGTLHESEAHTLTDLHKKCRQIENNASIGELEGGILQILDEMGIN